MKRYSYHGCNTTFGLSRARRHLLVDSPLTCGDGESNNGRLVMPLACGDGESNG